jgi:predicted Zn-dependent protease
MRAARPAFVLSVFAAVLLATTACSVIQEGAGVLSDTGKISAKDRDTIVKTSKAVRSTFAEITEEEEYYIGRSVSALILSKYKPYQNAALTSYLATMGTAISYSSDRPETYAGYRFIVLDTDEINAMAAPGGFIFITRGLLKQCKNEEMIAAVLAHEIGHVAARHGLQSIKKSRLVDTFKLIGTEAAKRYGPEELAQLTTVFEGVLDDVVGSLVERGYDRKYEYEADQAAVKFAVKTGYDPKGLSAFLKTLTGGDASGGAKGWFKTHPSAEDRLGRVNTQISGLGKTPATLAVRTDRFIQSVKGLR